MNAQRSAWSIPLRAPSRGAPYAGGYFDENSGLVHLWFCDDTMTRIRYTHGSVPAAVLDDLAFEVSGRRYYAALGQAVGCTQDGLFLFASLPIPYLPDGRFLDRLYYVVVDKAAAAWRSGSVSMSSFRLPDSTHPSDLLVTDGGRWLWDGRLITCLLSRRSARRVTSRRILYGGAMCVSGIPVLEEIVTHDETYDLLVVQIDTVDKAIVSADPIGPSGHRHAEVYSLGLGPFFWRETVAMQSVAREARFVSGTAVVHSQADRQFSYLLDWCTNVSSCSDTQRHALVYRGADVWVDQGSVVNEGPAAQRVLCNLHVPFLGPLASVIEHGARQGAYVAYRDRDTPIERIIGCGTNVVARIPIEQVTIGDRELWMTRLTAIGASDDTQWYDTWAIVGATDNTISLFLDSPSRTLVMEGKDAQGFTTWWLLTISLDTGRVVREVKLEPVDASSPVWEVEVDGTTHAMPMVSVLGGKPFKI
jgi:hypothetical protein